MKSIPCTDWPSVLQDPSGLRSAASNGLRHSRRIARGQTMIIDKGLGPCAFTDLLATAGDYVDVVKFGFGTAPLYPTDTLMGKIAKAKQRGITVMPGGTLLETAVYRNAVTAFFDTICKLGFGCVEVSDGTIELSRRRRTELIKEGKERGLRVMTEYGKKLSGSTIDADMLAKTAEADWAAGAELVTVEARESGVGVGLFNDQGECRDDALETVCRALGDMSRIMWEAPLKDQQVLLLKTFGPAVHLGNIRPEDALALETMRRGLRSDTFDFGGETEPARHMA